MSETGCTLEYSPGLLNDYGGGDIQWWFDYMTAEIGRCNDHWMGHYAILEAKCGRLHRAIDLVLDNLLLCASAYLGQDAADVPTLLAEGIGILRGALLREGKAVTRERDRNL